jgi:hypothetical protein
MVLIAEGAAAAGWALFHDVRVPARVPATALEQVFDRARAS